MKHPAAGWVLVWDLPTRLFHWVLAAIVAFELATGLFAPKAWFGRHIWCGYALGILLCLRLVWAFYGTEPSQLSSFLYSPRQAIDHLRSMFGGRPAHYLGHNPAGAFMIYALFATLVLMVVTGFAVQGGDLKQGPVAPFITFAVGETVRRIHQLLAYLLLALIVGHLAGVLAGSLVFRERLIGAMIDGRKPQDPDGKARLWRPSRPVMAIAWLAALAVLGGSLLTYLWRQPPLGVPVMPLNAAMVEECGACHNIFHPSLLSRASWAAIMADLPHHFGEDASLPTGRRDEIAAYLDKYAAEYWDTLPAHRFTPVAASDPLRITATPGWQRLHRGIDSATFTRPSVRGKSNCSACHADSLSGRFAPQSIAIPAH